MLTGEQTHTPQSQSAFTDTVGRYFPDSVVEKLAVEARKIAPQVFEAHRALGEDMPLNGHGKDIPDPPFSIEESKKLVIDAFRAFDEDLAARAEKIINDPRRCVLRDLDSLGPKDIRQMQCQPAETEDNPGKFAVVRLDYDGTINDAVYLAHEVGHAIADEMVRKAEFKHDDTKAHMHEIQSHLLQHAMYDHLSKHDDPAVRQGAEKHFALEMTRYLYHLPVGLAAQDEQPEQVFSDWLGENWRDYDAATEIADKNAAAAQGDKKAQERLDDRKDFMHAHPLGAIMGLALYKHIQQPENAAQKQDVIASLMGKNGPTRITDVLDAAGVDNAAKLDTLAKNTMSGIAASVPGLKSAVLESSFIAGGNDAPATVSKNEKKGPALTARS